MKFAFRRSDAIGCLRGRASVLWVSSAYVIMVGFWIKVHFVDGWRSPLSAGLSAGSDR